MKLGRKAAYAWLAEATGIAAADCHIGQMDAGQCRRAVECVRERFGGEGK